MNPASFSAGAVEKIASEWIIRRSSGLTSKEEAELAQWLTADSRNKATYERLSKTWNVFEPIERGGQGDNIATKVRFRAKTKRRQRLQLVAAASVVVCLAVLGGALKWSHRMTSNPVIENISELVRKLPDGSIVELNRGAEISVQYQNDFRKVHLVRGEAHFRVEKDAKRPFLVQVGLVEVKAVGTAFTIQIAAENVEVVVTEGKIAISENHAGATPEHATLVQAGSRALIKAEPTRPIEANVQQMTDSEMQTRMAWRAALLEFRGLNLGEAITLLNRVNRVQISCASTTIEKLRVSGTFRADNPEAFVRIVETSFDLVADRRGDKEIVLRRL